MAKVQTDTLLSLEQFSEILGYNPVHFNGALCAAYPDRSDVDDVIFRYAWQNYTQASHEEIAYAIAQAEEKIASYIGFYPAPKYIVLETMEFPRINTGGIGAGSLSFNQYNSLLRQPTVHLAWKKYISGGVRRVDEVALSVPVVYSDADGDGFSETATITVPGLTTTGWLPKEIGVYRDTDTSTVERIRGLRVTISGGTVTITGQSVLFLDPVAWDTARDGRAIDADDSTQFLGSVNVYREYCCDDGLAYASLYYLTQDATVSPLSAFAATYGILQPYNKERSIVSLLPATWDTTAGAWVNRAMTSYPDLIQMNYLAGVDTDNQGRMQPMLARAVAALATSMITKPVVSAGPPENLQNMWQALVGKGTAPFGVYSCPWGMRYGAYEAYSLVKDMFAEGIGTASL